MTSYTTVYDLPERLKASLTGAEWSLLTEPDGSYKVSLNTLSEHLLDTSAERFEELTNKIIDDITNFIYANAIHYVATADSDITKGTPVKLVSSVDSPDVHVDIATGNDIVLGVAEDDILTGVSGSFMVSGVLITHDTSSYTEGDILYFQNGATTTSPDPTLPAQRYAYVLNSHATEGKLMITNTENINRAQDIYYDNSNSDLVNTNVRTALDELAGRVQELEYTIFKGTSAPVTGLTEGDIWFNDTTKEMQIYRNAAWSKFLFADDVIDGGSW